MLKLGFLIFFFFGSVISCPLEHKPEIQDISFPNTRSLQSTGVQPIRIHFDFSGISSSSFGQSKLNYLTNILNEVGNYLSSIVKVERFWQIFMVNSSACYLASIPLIYQTTGIAADLLVFVTAISDSQNTNLEAWSVPCFVNQLAKNRTTVAELNILPEKIIEEPYYWGYLFNILTHEMIHILGLNTMVYDYFVDSSGNRLGIENVIKNISVRGSWKYAVVTNKVLQATRSHFNCPYIVGAELENQGSNASVASHWERRVFGDEIMTASAVIDSSFSNITLSFLEDTGWYTIDYSKADEFKFGKNMGCNFINEKCIQNSVSLFPWYFTTNLDHDGCVYDFTKRGKSSVRYSGSIPSEFNYFNATVVALDPYSDNCPSYVSYDVGDCRAEINQLYSGLIDESYGSDSRCFMGTFFKESNASFYDEHYTNAACFKTKCILNSVSNFTLQIYVGNLILTCPSQGGNITIPGYKGELFCPQPNYFCPLAFANLCPNDCSNQGTCSQGVCSCNSGYYGGECSMANCSDSSYCTGNGICNETTKKCDCFDGWGGRNCKYYTYEYFSPKYDFIGDSYQNRCVINSLPHRTDACPTKDTNSLIHLTEQILNFLFFTLIIFIM